MVLKPFIHALEDLNIMQKRYELTEQIGSLSKGTVFTLTNGVFTSGKTSLLPEDVVNNPLFKEVK